MADSALLFEWRRLVASEHGPHPTMRHVLLTLSLHMNADGSSCYPSIRRLAVESGLHRGTVNRHLQLAEEDGWLDRTLRGLQGQGWKRLEYRPAFPRGVRRERTPSENVSAEDVHLSGEGVRSLRQKVSAQSGLSSTTTSSKKNTSGFDAVDEVFERCRILRDGRLGKVSGPALQLTQARRSAINARLSEGFTQADLEDAAAGFFSDTWKDRDQYLDPKYAFKDDETVRHWMAAHRNGAGTRPANVQEAEWLRE